jgi:hypothetical protein
MEPPIPNRPEVGRIFTSPPLVGHGIAIVSRFGGSTGSRRWWWPRKDEMETRELAAITPIRSKEIRRAQVALEREYHRHRAMLTVLLDDIAKIDDAPQQPRDTTAHRVDPERRALMVALADHHRAALDSIQAALGRLDAGVPSLGG